MLNMKEKKRFYFLYKNGILSKYEMIIYRYMKGNTRRYLIFYISIFSIKYIFDALTIESGLKDFL